MARFDIVGDLGPGDKFFYKDTYYIIIDFKPATTNALAPDMIAALDTDTYKVVCFNNRTEVEVLYYFGGTC